MLQPLGNRLLVKQIEAKTKVGNIYIPDTVENTELKAIVVAVGPGKKHIDGLVIPVGVSVDDVILYGKFAGQDLYISGEKYKILTSEDVLGVFDKEVTE